MNALIIIAPPCLALFIPLLEPLIGISIILAHILALVILTLIFFFLFLFLRTRNTKDNKAIATTAVAPSAKEQHATTTTTFDHTDTAVRKDAIEIVHAAFAALKSAPEGTTRASFHHDHDHDRVVKHDTEMGPGDDEFVMSLSSSSLPSLRDWTPAPTPDQEEHDFSNNALAREKGGEGGEEEEEEEEEEEPETPSYGPEGHISPSPSIRTNTSYGVYMRPEEVVRGGVEKRAFRAFGSERRNGFYHLRIRKGKREGDEGERK